MKVRCDRLALVTACLASIVCASRASAAPTGLQELMERARAEAPARPALLTRSSAELPDFGSAAEFVNIGAYAFQGASGNGEQFGDDGNGYRYLISSASGGYLAAPVRVPAGAMIDFLVVNYCAGATGDLALALLDGLSYGAPAATLASIATGGNDDCWQTVQTVGHLYDSANGHPLYVVIHWEGPMDGTLKFNSVWLTYHRTVSPPPGVATFDDVPTGHPFFQYVEALAASGITGGCGNGNYCPGAPLTRGQMAVFLSKALGLNWPN